MRVLNAYAGIGGNRHLWPTDWEITAVELDPRVAAEYARRYPDDTVLVEDAHAFVLEHAHEFDAVWSSPPCPTHSKLARTVAAKAKVELAPDPRLWAEIAHLQALGGRYVVENVHVYYAPPIAPDVVTERHWYWVSEVPMMLTPLTSTSRAALEERAADRTMRPADRYADAYGLPRLPVGAVALSRKAMRNAVVPQEGLEIAVAAFNRVLVSHRNESTEQEQSNG